MFSDSDSDNEDKEHQFTINEHYAKAFEYRKEREELAKLKEKYGSDAEVDDEDDSEDGESEDEDGEELTPAVDAAILRTLARIKRKDPAIYEEGKDVFEEEKAKTGETNITKRSKQDKSKPLTLRQHALASALNGDDSRSPSPQPLTYVQEQEALKQETIKAFHADVSDDDEDDLLVLREKTKDEVEREEEEYKDFLQREVGQDLKELITISGDDEPGSVHAEDVGEEKSKKEEKKAKREKMKDKGTAKPSKDEDDRQFLLDYILNRGWIDNTSRRLPTYKEITSSKSKKGKGKQEDAEDSDDRSDGEEEVSAGEDAEFEDVADVFETSYNFRFEEPDAADIARYPRNIATGVRREDTTRKDARERRKQRKEEELLQKREEVKRLKALKLKEVRAKLEKIGKEGGVSLEDEALRELDLEADWDPDAHDRQMVELYGNDDAFPDEDEYPEDDEKPTWDDDIDVGDIMDQEGPSTQSRKKKKKKKKAEDAMDIDGVDVNDMDADLAPTGSGDEEDWDGTEESRKKALDRYMDELYKMEFNDLVGGMPTRFHYTQVPPTSYALTPVEILLSTDAELNQYMGIKKYAPYRDKKREGWDQSRNARLSELKEKIGGRRWGNDVYGSGRTGDREGGAGPSGKDRPKKRKGKKERMKSKAVVVEADDGVEPTAQEMPASVATSKKRVAEDSADISGVADEGPSKKRRRRHKKAGVSEET
ncbi:hypothetical protein EUX98_g7935 [Antrodiella citrinella]|uniref:Kri1-like C-terminal domain-containing protein n=1 Tax=Antrodiella citrinella TaxID=2447956 RepID=A0A4V3XGY1_9APHY|nr:hypothetical protein EUX98_g7935 [Antrodiella citrinella]